MCTSAPPRKRIKRTRRLSIKTHIRAAPSTMFSKQVVLITASALCLTWGSIAFVKTAIMDTDAFTLESLRKKMASDRTVDSDGGRSESSARNGSSGSSGNGGGGSSSSGQSEPAPVTMNHTTTPSVSSASLLHNVTSSKYTLPAFETSSFPNKHKPLPVQVLEQYMEWHSVDSLRRDPHNRKFSVVFYSCPLQAGNRLHHFWTGMFWSILTNRTMLWKYWDTETCFRYGSTYNLDICREANTAPDCDPILARAPWIASYDEWRDLLHLPEPHELPFYTTHPPRNVNIRYPWGPGNDEQSMGVDVKYNDIPIAIFAQTHTKISFMTSPETAHSLLHSNWSRRINSELHSQGVDFMFGMLQRYSFELTDHMKASTPNLAYRFQGNKYYTIALHSRHIDGTMDGCDISREQHCMQQIIQKIHRKKQECVVNLMSDRSCTISALTPWLQDHGCQVLVASHDNRIDYKSEHGPFAGAGFFQDMALASTARSAFIGLKRSSSDLVLELLSFYRKMEEWQAQDGGQATLDICIIRNFPPNSTETKVYDPKTKSSKDKRPGLNGQRQHHDATASINIREKEGTYNVHQIADLRDREIDDDDDANTQDLTLPRDSQLSLNAFRIHVDWHPKNRSQRFPSVEERVKLYMSNWYLPPCPNASRGRFAGKYERSDIQPFDGDNASWPVLKIMDPWSSSGGGSTSSNNILLQQVMVIDSYVDPGRTILLHCPIVEDCGSGIRKHNKGPSCRNFVRAMNRTYQSEHGHHVGGETPTFENCKRRSKEDAMGESCRNIIELLNIMDQLDHQEGDEEKTPILALLHGDTPGLRRNQQSFEIPLFAKYRAGATEAYIEEVTGSTILGAEKCCKDARSPVKTAYHQDQYRNKLSPIIWKLEVSRHWEPLRKAMRQDRPWKQKRNGAIWRGAMTGSGIEDYTDLEHCLLNQRCRFVLDHADSKLIDAGITNQHGKLENSTIEAVVKGWVGKDIMQEYKVIISLEGNDVSSGLKWMLQSQSVVLMPPPTRTSWAMEERLESWVHYIPMFPNGSNAEEMVQWVLDNEREAQQISERATLFMYDLLYHADAESDDRKIKEEMARRYRALWH